MATPASIAIRRQAAVTRLQTAAATLSKQLGVAAPDLQSVHKDADIARAMELETLADFLEAVVLSGTAIESTSSSGKKK